MKISVIIPIYKVENYLRQCVNSVLAQSYKDIEIILVDDGSPDGCPAICDEYGLKDSRIKVIHKPNGGLSDARNFGIEAATGDYLMFLDSDDWWDDIDAVKKVVDRLSETDADVCIIGMKKYFQLQDRYSDERTPLCDEASALSQAHALNKYMNKNIFVACACDKALRRSFVESDKQRFVKGQLSEDIEWCCKILKKNPRITTLPISFYVYRQQVSTSISSNVSKRHIENILDIISRYTTKDATEPMLHYLANQYVLLMTTMTRLPKLQQAELDSCLHSYWWLLNKNWYPYVKKVSYIKFLGFRFTKKLLGIYYNRKNL